MTLAKPQQNLALPLEVQRRIDEMFAGSTGLSGPEMLQYFARHDDSIEQYPWSGGAPSRRQILQDCLARFPKEQQFVLLKDMLQADIFGKYPPPTQDNKQYLLQWIESQEQTASPVYTSRDVAPVPPARPRQVDLVFKERAVPEPPPTWDVFVSHAHEDKASIAEPLASALAQYGVRVWYDSFELSLGDSLRKSIDRGLANSRFGIVVLSHSFFAKHWPQAELDGLVSRETEGIKVVLPVWHGITAADVQRYSPMLAGRLAVSTDRGLDEVVQQVINVVRPGRTAG